MKGRMEEEMWMGSGEEADFPNESEEEGMKRPTNAVSQEIRGEGSPIISSN